jgi:hypothetical protein
MALLIDEKLRELNLTLPAPPTPGGNYLPAKTIGSIVFLAGVISIGPDGVIGGTAGLNRTIDEGYAVTPCKAFPTRPKSSTAHPIYSSSFSATSLATSARPSAFRRCRATRSSSCK